MAAADRVRNGIVKLRWGVGAVGLPRALGGLARYGALRLRGPRTAEVTLRRSGVRLRYRHPSQTVPLLVVFGDVIDPEYDFLARVLRPGWTVVDVGAAIGQFTIFCARTAEVRAHAFEPSGGNVAALTRNAELNGVADRVSVHAMALSDHAGEAVFATADVTYVSGLSGPVAGQGGERVRVETLPGVCRELGLGHIDVLKVNVAGHEPAVLAGAEPYLAGGGADVLILLIGLDSLPWYAKLHEMGYRFFFYEPRSGLLHEVGRFDEHGFLGSRPSPARHVIAIRGAAFEQVTGGRVGLLS
ncbi:FkbM family methyltransferase [Sphaerisporangium fuscum]|uniref:FkbM family methyltransferase n=1 Tax=Sphaerisporangium fuscum TaxID=2835868 RepID=UPI001BDC0624|nr:FkbM family methyltransferase [Sphaerisporangium fuscum]